MDILSDELARARAQGALFSVLRRTGPWGLRFAGDRPLTAHILLDQDGWLERAGHEPLPLRAREVVLATAGEPYSVVSEPGAVTVPIGEARQRGSDLSPGPAATVLCGAYVLSGSVAATLLSSIPRFAVVAATEPGHAAAVDLLAVEINRDGPGQQALLDRLLDLNLVYALRSWWQQADVPAPGWFRAMGHPALRRLLEELHAHPERPWTVATMAQATGLSRAAFAELFHRLVGQTPSRYLTGLRMSRAQDALIRSDVPLASIAVNAGYRNQFAFATAFRRAHGLSPGRWRQQAHGSPPPS
ncbi:cupin domain-containing protein [Actinoplanes sp. HUAS TT8]|uniref:AraC family transcriptional regulator n=1 Tax=Actinoplanes sp. HUAS TT8 TaxID=3447453 RepID=UPI003F51DFA1